jgi:tRNA(fMet)-specific endonuclease VapC
VEVKLLLDTNRLSDALAMLGEVVDTLEIAEEICVPVVALGEIRAGFLRGSRPATNETRLQWFLSQNGVSVLGVDAPISHRYAEIHRSLRALGKRIPTNDLWVAAIAIEHGLSLYTRDTHFGHVPGLACL